METDGLERSAVWKYQCKEYRRTSYGAPRQAPTPREVEGAYAELKRLEDMRSGPMRSKATLAAATEALKRLWIEDGSWGAAAAASEAHRRQRQEEEAAAAAATQ